MMHSRYTSRRAARPLQRALMLLLVGAALGGTFGCEALGLSDPVQTPAVKKTTPKKKTPPPAAPPVASAEDEVDYQRPEYPNNTRRNPFQPIPEAIQPVGTINVPETREKEESEKYGLNQLALVAIISQTAVPRALFVDPQGFGHILKTGDRIGRQGGIITDIRQNEVDIQETAGEDDAAQSRVKTIVLQSMELASQEPVDEAGELSDAEQRALRDLLKSEEGRKLLNPKFREQAQDAQQQANYPASQNDNQGGVLPPTITP